MKGVLREHLDWNGARHQPMLGLERLVLARGPFNLILRPLQALLPVAVQLRALGLDPAS
nr:hypothetical protein [Gammaproteobacteria bacterium]